MAAHDRMIAALKEMQLPFKEVFYSGKAEKYIVYQEVSSRDTDFADDEPVEETVQFEVHYVCTDKRNDDTDAVYHALKKILRRNGFYVTEKQRIADKALDYVKIIIYCNISIGLED